MDNNISKKQGNYGSANQNSTFLSNDIENLLKTLRNKAYVDNTERNNLLLNVIRIKQPISKYELAKITNLSYPTIKTVCKGLQFVDLISMRMATGENGMPVQLVYIKKEEVQDGTN